MTQPMKVEFDPGGILTMIDVWRNAPELQTPAEDEFNFKRIEAQLAIYRSYQASAEGWNFILLSMKPIGDQIPMKLLQQKIAAFTNWAKEEAKNLETLRDELKFLYEERK
jgi:hypothetical protein